MELSVRFKSVTIDESVSDNSEDPAMPESVYVVRDVYKYFECKVIVFVSVQS